MRNEFNSFPSGKERKAAVRDSEDATYLYKKLVESETEEKPRVYKWINSPADGGEYVEGEGKPFAESFIGIIPNGEVSLSKYIEKSLYKKDGNAIGVEFGGVGSRLFSGFTPGFFDKSIGVSLVELRKNKDLIYSQEEDREINHEILIGNIFYHKTYELLNKSLGGAKIDLIISRMAGGLEFVPREPYAVSEILQIWYKLLSEEGIMFVQTPVFFNSLLIEWANKITREYKEVLEMQYKLGQHDANTYCSAFRIRKLPGAPLDLPLLHPKIVRNAFPFHEDI
jgi:hypothetical protein